MESLNSEKTNKSASFDDEEYVVYDNRIVSIGEREAGVIENSDGTTIKVEQKDFETRIRPLKKTNWIILSPTHPANNSPYETQITRLMEDILSGEKTLKDLSGILVASAFAL